jgi:hypothetical protein
LFGGSTRRKKKKNTPINFWPEQLQIAYIWSCADAEFAIWMGFLPAGLEGRW